MIPHVQPLGYEVSNDGGNKIVVMPSATQLIRSLNPSLMSFTVPCICFLLILSHLETVFMIALRVRLSQFFAAVSSGFTGDILDREKKKILGNVYPTKHSP